MARQLEGVWGSVSGLGRVGSHRLLLRGHVAGRVSQCWLLPGSLPHSAVSQGPESQESPGGSHLGRERGQRQGPRLSLCGAPRGHHSGQPGVRSLCHRQNCPWLAGSALSLAGSSLSRPPQETAQEREFFGGCKTTALSPSKQRCSSFQRRDTLGAGGSWWRRATECSALHPWKPFPAAAQAPLSSFLQVTPPPAGAWEAGPLPECVPGTAHQPSALKSASKRPACWLLQWEFLSLVPCATRPSPVGTDLQMGSWGRLSSVLCSLLPPPARNHSTRLSPLKHSRCMPGGHSSSQRSDRRALMEYLPGRFRSRADAGRAIERTSG